MNTELLQKKSVELRADIVEMLYHSKSGHPGGALSCIDMLIALYNEVANVDPQNPKDENRDRIIMSKGHACPALYVALADKGYFPREDLWTLRKFHSPLQGHPDMRKCKGVDANAGSLGQGVSVAVGMAMAAKFKKKDYKVFAIMGDGESQEGLTWEAAEAAVHYGLDNYVLLLDHNGLQIDGKNSDVMDIGDMVKKYEAFGFQTFKIDGHNFDELIAALKAPTEPGKPKFICCETVKGKGVSFMENQVGWHGKAPNAEQLKQAFADLGVSR
ncbi:MAG: transketolase [Clostridia bacterium]|nr:transketolase [Clostridia bacterium]